MPSHPAVPGSYAFVSYTSADRPRVRAIVDRLQAAGINVWMDERNISGATIYGTEIVDGIRNCAVFIVVCSAASLRSRNVRQEIQLAWKYERPYLPLLLEQVTVPPELEYWLEGWQWVSIESRPESEWLPQVLTALDRGGLGEGSEAPAPAVTATRAPAEAAPVPPKAAGAAPTPVDRTPGRGGERKLVTVLAIEVTDAATLAQEMDEEEARLVVAEAHAGLIDDVARHEGYVLRLDAGSLVALFGLPLVHEDDAERAARAALAMVERTRASAEEIRRAWGIEGFSLRAGLHTAEIELDEAEFGGEGDAVEQAAALAERIRSLAPAFGVLASAGSSRQLRRRFALRGYPVEPGDDGEVMLELFQVAQQGGSGGDENAAQQQAAVVGREAELGLLRDAFSALQDGQGQIVAVIGEAGIGKSRLVDEARRAGAAEESQIRWLEGRALSYGGALPYRPITQILKADMGLGESDPDARLRVALRRRCGALLGGQAADLLPLLGHLLGARLDHESEERLRATDADALRRQVIAAVAAYVEALAEAAPTVLVFEDLHWVDPSTLAALEALLPLTDRVPLMLLLLFRPEREHESWQLKLQAETDFGHRYSEIVLRPLSSAAAATLVQSLAPQDELNESLRRQVLERAEGNPLYLEEIVRDLIESHRGGGGGGGEAGLASSGAVVPAGAMPVTLQGVLQARIDRLAEGPRRVLQAAAVIGRSFSYRLLEAVAGPQHELEPHLTQLQHADLVREKGRRPDLEYTFKHALTQEAAYGALSARRRRELHTAVGAALEELYAGRTREVAGLLAQHFKAGGVGERALHYSAEAARQAAAQFSAGEALAYFATALELAEPGPARGGLLLDRATLLMALFRGVEARADIEQALEEARARGNRQDELAALLKLANAYYVISLDDAEAGAAAARETYEQTYALAKELGDRATMVRSLFPTASLTDYWPGYGAQAKANVEEALALSLELGDEELIIESERARTRFLGARESAETAEANWLRMQASGNLSRLNLATFYLMWTHLRAGNFERCVERCDDGTRLARQIGAEPVQYATLKEFALLQLGRFDEAWQALQQEVSGESHPLGAAMQRLGEGIYLYELGAWEEAVRALNESIERARRLMRAWMIALAQAYLAKVLARLGRPAEFQAEGGVLWPDAQAELALAEETPDAALEYAERAIELAARRDRPPDGLVAAEVKLRALLALGRAAEALPLAVSAVAEAETMQCRLLLWQLLAAQMQAQELLGEVTAAGVTRQAATEALRTLSATIPEVGLRERFEAQPPARAILGVAPAE